MSDGRAMSREQGPVRAPDPYEARARVLRAALRCLSARLADEHAMADAEVQYASEQLAIAARDLVNATNAMDPGDQPVGWSRDRGVA